MMEGGILPNLERSDKCDLCKIWCIWEISDLSEMSDKFLKSQIPLRETDVLLINYIERGSIGGIAPSNFGYQDKR